MDEFAHPAVQDIPRLALNRRGFLFAASATALSTVGATASAFGKQAEAGTSQAGLENLRNFVRLISSANAGEETINHIRYRLYSITDRSELVRPLIDWEGWGAMRFQPDAEGGFTQLFNQIGFWRDLETGEILDEWDNPLTGERVEVVHSTKQNYNARLSPTIDVGGGRTIAFPFPAREMGDWVLYDAEMAVGPRENPIQPDEFPEYSTGETERFSEFFQFFAPRAAFEDETQARLPMAGATQRLGAYPFWMRMGARPGMALLKFTVAKVSGVEALPGDIVEYAREHHPAFLSAPESWADRRDGDLLWLERHRARREG